MDEDDEIARILAMTEAELRADVAARGLDWETKLATVKSCFELAVADCAFRRWVKTGEG